MSVRVRFAPSPTGRLHVGNIKAALVNWLFARKAGGQFLLRLDDTDTDRGRPEFAAAIEEDLAWLGLHWDAFARQSDRLDRYRESAEKLEASGRLYPCYETAEELDLRRKLQRARGLPPVYDRGALKLTEADRARLEGEGRRPHWRFRLSDRAVSWPDLIHGPVTLDLRSLSDPVLIRADGRVLYTLSSIVDDIDFRMSHVIRAEDHLTNTAPQIDIFEALGALPPAFGHFSLLVDASGEGFSKREGSLSVGQLREQGVEPLAILSLLARLGTADPVEPRAALADLVAGFDLSRLGRAPAHFNRADLDALNARVLHLLPFEAVRDRLGIEGAGEAFWLAVRGNLGTLAQAKDWWAVVEGPIAPVVEDAEYLAAAAAELPAGDLDGGSWEAWIARLKTVTGRKGRALFHPLRLALTAREHGPEMRYLLPLIGRTRALARLAGKSA